MTKKSKLKSSQNLKYNCKIKTKNRLEFEYLNHIVTNTGNHTIYDQQNCSKSMNSLNGNGENAHAHELISRSNCKSN